MRVTGSKEILTWGWDGNKLLEELIKLDYLTIDNLTNQQEGDTKQWVGSYKKVLHHLPIKSGRRKLF